MRSCTKPQVEVVRSRGSAQLIPLARFAACPTSRQKDDTLRKCREKADEAKAAIEKSITS